MNLSQYIFSCWNSVICLIIVWPFRLHFATIGSWEPFVRYYICQGKYHRKMEGSVDRVLRARERESEIYRHKIGAEAWPTKQVISNTRFATPSCLYMIWAFCPESPRRITIPVFPSIHNCVDMVRKIYLWVSTNWHLWTSGPCRRISVDPDRGMIHGHAALAGTCVFGSKTTRTYKIIPFACLLLKEEWEIKVLVVRVHFVA